MPRPRGRRVPIATNIYRDDIGIAAVARVPGRKPKELRFKRGTALKTIRAALDNKRTEMRRERDTGAALSAPGTVSAIVTAYLALFKNETAKKNAATLLAPWVSAIGGRQTETLTKADVLEVILAWEERARVAEEAVPSGQRRPRHGHAASTINHRRRELAKAWDAILPEAKNVVRQVRKSREPDAERRDQPMDLLDAIIDTIPDKSTGRRRHMPNKSKARLRAMLWTGFSPKMIAMTPLHAIHVWKTAEGEDGGEVDLPARKKGRGAPAVTIPLFPKGARSMHGLVRAFAIGKFSTSSVWKTFKRACRRYVAQQAELGVEVYLPPDLHPYDLRHSFLSWVSDTTNDPQLVQFLAQHLVLETTSRYTKSAIERRAARLVRRVDVAPARGTRPLKSASTSGE